VKGHRKSEDKSSFVVENVEINEIVKVRKTQEGGLNCVYFFSFSPTEVTVQKQIELSF